MEEMMALNSLELCRMCGICGHHEIDILDDKSQAGNNDSNRIALSEKIFKCVSVRVKRNDKMSNKLCQRCFDKIIDFDSFRDLCIATNIRMRILCGLPTEDNGADSPDPVQEVAKANGTSPDGILPLRVDVDGVSTMNDDIDFCSNQAGRTTPFEEGELTDEEISNILNTDLISVERPTGSDDEAPMDLLHGNPPVVRASSSEDTFDSDVEIVITKSQSAKKRIGNSALKNKCRTKRIPIKEDGQFVVDCRVRGGCRESFEDWDTMMYHVATYHAKGIKRKFSCHLCKKTSTYRKDLQKHMDAVHVGLRRFKCPFPKCSQAFAQNGVLQRHTNAIHTKKIEFKCKKCPAKFYRKSQLTRHLANKHGQGITYSCHLCEKSLCDKQSLQHHMNLFHTGQSLFQCPGCPKRFASNCNLKMHLKSKAHCGRNQK